jgi:hydroxymethylglutaryl-CoA synthase
MTDAAEPKIEAVGAYAPRFRISAEEFEQAWGQFHASGMNSKAVPEADEDALTMAYEAAARALDAADRAGADVSFLAFATTNPPLAEEDLTARLGGMLGVPGESSRHVFTGSTRAGTRAVDAALAAGPWGDSVGLVVAADCPRGDPDSPEDHAAGAGAAAFVLSDAGESTVVGRVEYAAEYPGTRFRQTGSETVEGLGATGYEREAFTETLAGAVEQLELGEADASDLDAAAVQAPDGKLPYRAAGALGVDTETIQRGVTVHDLGDAGAASVPLGLATALARGDDRILAASFGSGAGADALLVENRGVRSSVRLEEGESVSYAEYLRKRGEITSGAPAGGGAYVSVPSWKRTLDQRHRLIAGRCPECGSLNFPPDGACNSCKTLVDEYEQVKLTGAGTVEVATVISQGGAPPEFAEQQAQSGDFGVVVVALEGPDGGSASVPAQVVGAEPGAVEIGDRVETTMRRIYTQEGVTRYGFKVRPR